MAVYVGYGKCGCPLSAAIDDPEYREITSEHVKEMLLKGYKVERRNEAPECGHRCNNFDGMVDTFDKWWYDIGRHAPESYSRHQDAKAAYCAGWAKCCGGH